MNVRPPAGKKPRKKNNFSSIGPIFPPGNSPSSKTVQFNFIVGMHDFFRRYLNLSDHFLGQVRLIVFVIYCLPFFQELEIVGEVAGDKINFCPLSPQTSRDIADRLGMVVRKTVPYDYSGKLLSESVFPVKVSNRTILLAYNYQPL